MYLGTFNPQTGHVCKAAKFQSAVTSVSLLKQSIMRSLTFHCLSIDDVFHVGIDMSYHVVYRVQQFMMKCYGNPPYYIHRSTGGQNDAILKH